jgi:hypothetical protein
LYNLILNLFTPSTVAVAASDDAAIPTNRKMNNLSLAGNGIGLNLSNNLVLFGTSPLTLTASATAPGNVLNLGGNNLLFTWNGYAGTTTTYGATKAYITNGSMTLTGRGGGTSGSTFNFPFSGAVSVFTGGGSSTAVTGGTDALTVKVTEVGAPTNAALGSGIALGSRAFKVETATTFGAATASSTLFGGTAPTVRLNYNEQDGLTTTQPQTFVLESTSLNGAWNVRSASIGTTGALTATGGFFDTSDSRLKIIIKDNHQAKGIENVVVIDERTARMLCEDPGKLRRLMEEKLRTRISIKKDNLRNLENINFLGIDLGFGHSIQIRF